MDRREQLLKIIDGNETFLPLVDEILFLEKELDERKKLPFIKVHPRDPTKQKATPAAKQYKEFLQQYANCIKIIGRISGQDEKDEESPLRRWVKNRVNSG